MKLSFTSKCAGLYCLSVCSLHAYLTAQVVSMLLYILIIIIIIIQHKHCLKIR